MTNDTNIGNGNGTYQRNALVFTYEGSELVDLGQSLAEFRDITSETVHDGVQAVERLKSGNFDFVLMGINPFNQPGIETLNAAYGNGISVPVVVVSDYARNVLIKGPAHFFYTRGVDTSWAYQLRRWNLDPEDFKIPEVENIGKNVRAIAKKETVLHHLDDILRQI